MHTTSKSFASLENQSLCFVLSLCPHHFSPLGRVQAWIGKAREAFRRDVDVLDPEMVAMTCD